MTNTENNNYVTFEQMFDYLFANPKSRWWKEKHILGIPYSSDDEVCWDTKSRTGVLMTLLNLHVEGIRIPNQPEFSAYPDAAESIETLPDSSLTFKLYGKVSLYLMGQIDIDELIDSVVDLMKKEEFYDYFFEYHSEYFSKRLFPQLDAA